LLEGRAEMRLAVFATLSLVICTTKASGQNLSWSGAGAVSCAEYAQAVRSGGRLLVAASDKSVRRHSGRDVGSGWHAVSGARRRAGSGIKGGALNEACKKGSQRLEAWPLIGALHRQATASGVHNGDDDSGGDGRPSRASCAAFPFSAWAF